MVETYRNLIGVEFILALPMSGINEGFMIMEYSGVMNTNLLGHKNLGLWKE